MKSRKPFQRLHAKGISCIVATALLAGVLAIAVVPQAASAAAAPSWFLNASPSLSTSATEANFANSVSCASSRFCESVGYFVSGSGSSASVKGLILTWNGNTWSIDSAVPLPTGGFLDSISCASTRFCVAVGAYVDGNGS